MSLNDVRSDLGTASRPTVWFLDDDHKEWIKPLVNHLNFNCPCMVCGERKFYCCSRFSQNYDDIREGQMFVCLSYQIRCEICAYTLLFPRINVDEYIKKLKAAECSLFESRTEEEFTKKLNHIVSEVK